MKKELSCDSLQDTKYQVYKKLWYWWNNNKTYKVIGVNGNKNTETMLMIVILVNDGDHDSHNNNF